MSVIAVNVICSTTTNVFRLGVMCRVNIFGIEYMQLEVSMTVVITMILKEQ